jgi:hypothetical protein
MKRVAVHTLALAIGLVLGACSPEPQDENRERASQDMQDAGRGASDAERDEVAGALAEDVASLAQVSAAAAEPPARATEKSEAPPSAVGNVIASECVELQQSLATLKQSQSAPPDGEFRTADELESIQGEIERIATRLQETCGRE